MTYCHECVHFRQCQWLLSRRGEEAECDWIPSKFQFRTRLAVDKFAVAMEQKLQEHAHDRGKDGWLTEDVGWLLDRLKEETEELFAAIVTDPEDENWTKRAMEEAVDIANFAMMIYDRVRYDHPGTN